MDDLSTKTALIMDYGLFSALAETLARSFGRVLYYVPWKSDFPQTWVQKIGSGLPGVTRIDDFFDYVDKADIIVFPDIYDGDLQVYLEKQGKRVWGSRKGDALERDRVGAKKYMASIGLTIGDYLIAKGCDQLRETIKVHGPLWVKGTDTRWFESFYAKNYRTVETKIDQIEYELGPDKHDFVFVCERPIKDAVELASDGVNVDGNCPSCGTIGIEAKNEAYIGIFRPYERWPQQMRDINEALAPKLEEFGYRNAFAVEYRQTRDGKAYILDPCCRLGAPPNELLQEMYGNLAQIIWEGADGECIDPIPTGKFGAEIILHCDRAKTEWVPVHFPQEIRRYVKLRKSRRKNGVDYVRGVSEIGAVVCVADSMDEAIEGCKEYAEQVEVCEGTTGADSLSKIKDDIRRLKEFGVTL